MNEKMLYNSKWYDYRPYMPDVANLLFITEWVSAYDKLLVRMGFDHFEDGRGSVIKKPFPYNGTQPQNYATMNRFKLAKEVDYPDKRTEARILKQKTGVMNTDGLIDKLVEVARLVRNAHKQDEIQATMSTRTLVVTTELYLDFCDILEAYELSFLTLLSEEDRLKCRAIIQQVWAV